MSKIVTILAIVLSVVALVVSLGAGSQGQPSFGDATTSNFPTWFYNGLKVGHQNVLTSKLLTGTCATAATNNLPWTATSTAYFTCTVTGAQPGDQVKIIPSVNPVAWGGLVVTAASSSKSNTISYSMLNLTGQATSSFPLATSTVGYFISSSTPFSNQF